MKLKRKIAINLLWIFLSTVTGRICGQEIRENPISASEARQREESDQDGRKPAADRDSKRGQDNIDGAGKRVIIYINRELITEKSRANLKSVRELNVLNTGDAASSERKDGQKLNTTVSSVTNIVDNTNSSSSSLSKNIQTTNSTSIELSEFEIAEARRESASEKKLIRDVERLLGRELRRHGFKLVDQRTANQLIGGDFNILTDRVRMRIMDDKEREVIKKLADFVLEVIISDSVVPDREVSGADSSFTIPEVRLTAIRIGDAQILGQFSSWDSISAQPKSSLRTIGLNELVRVSALGLIEDMNLGAE
jgi:hypothetical protein